MAEPPEDPKRSSRRQSQQLIVTVRPRGLPEEAAAAYIGISVGTLQMLVRTGKLPRPRQVSPARVVHEISDLDAYMDSCPRSTLPPGPGRRRTL